MPSKPRSTATPDPLKPSWLRIPSFQRSCASSIKAEKRAALSKRNKATGMSKLEIEFERQLVEAGLPEPVREYRFHPTRRWRFDFAWVDPETGTGPKVAAEIDGAVWINGRHNRGAGIKSDADKYNEAQLRGWLVLRFTSEHLKDGTAIQYTKEALGL